MTVRRIQTDLANPDRRRLLELSAMAPPLLIAGGGLTACTTVSGDHAIDEPHLGHGPYTDAWRAIETARLDSEGFAGGFPGALEEMHGEELALDGFVRRTPNLGRLVLTRRAVGCSVCNRQKLWPVVDLVLAEGSPFPDKGAVTIRGRVDLRRSGDQLPLGLKQAEVLSA